MLKHCTKFIIDNNEDIIKLYIGLELIGRDITKRYIITNINYEYYFVKDKL